MKGNAMRTRISILVLASLLAVPTLFGAGNNFGLTVLVDDSARPEYWHNGTLYIEAVRGSSYALRLTNPTPYRVAVALSVDGLNTIDARHTDARGASKWVLEPYESTVISGWQINERTARDFYFTGERGSYGARLGQTDNLGVIEAVFYRERRPRISEYTPRVQPGTMPQAGNEGAVGGTTAPSARAEAQSKKDALSDDYAATGMGNRERHEIEVVSFDLESTPAASVRIRYEFTAQLVKLGILPSASPIERRERAQGFAAFCPER